MKTTVYIHRIKQRVHEVPVSLKNFRYELAYRSRGIYNRQAALNSHVSSTSLIARFRTTTTIVHP
jgi:hypothetical protein